jgi:hypothetical protein
MGVGFVVLLQLLTAGCVEGFGCWPITGRAPSTGAGVRKPSKNETAGGVAPGRAASYGDSISAEDAAGSLGDG